MASTSLTTRRHHPLWSALLLGCAIFALLWLLNIPYRQAYQLTENDVTALVDGLLLLPGARWEDWFTRGHSHFFDTYPEWPWGLAPFARPAFQYLIYLAHFIFGRDWASYLAINYLGIAGVAAVAFAIARTALGLGAGASLLAAALVGLSPAVLESSIWQVGFASESVASVLIGCAFLAVLARRDLLCLVLLPIALLTKETAAWAPVAAALTVLLRPERGDALRHRALAAAAMLLPLALWVGFRFAFYGGAGRSYATAGYTPFIDFLNLAGWKLAHLHRLFVSQEVFVTEGRWAAERALMIGGYGVLWLLLVLWALSGLGAVLGRFRQAVRERRWPAADAALLVTLWAALGLAFYFALAVAVSRFAASAVMFVWPAVVGEVARRRIAVLRLGLAACFVLSLARTSHLLVERNPPSEQTGTGRLFRSIAATNAAVRQVPAGIRQVYVLSAGGLVPATPDYLRVFLDVRAEIVRVVDILSRCKGGKQVVAFDHDRVDGVVTLSATLLGCASFRFQAAGRDSTLVRDGRLRRSDSISYELPEANFVKRKDWLWPDTEFGQRITVHIRPRGPARFIIERGGPDGGLAWFDTP